jgi:predicted GIY-YIG superfamily endonuclease
LEKHYVYHIKVSGMSLDEGYVGVTNRPLERFEEHKKSRYNPYLRRAMQKYKGQLIFQILDVFEDRHEAPWLEYTLRPFRQIGWNIAVGGETPPRWAGKTHAECTKKKMSASAKGRVISVEQREKISKKLTGIKYSEERIARLNPITGTKHHNAKPCNIYDNKTGELLAECVTVNGWAKENGVQQSALSLTAKADRSKPSNQKNRHHTKGVYARYI